MVHALRNRRRRQLKELPLFRGVPDDVLYSVERVLAWKEFGKGELLYTPEEEDNRLYVVMQGRVALFAPHDAKRFVLAELVPGDIFGMVDAGREVVHSSHASYRGNFAEGLEEGGVVASVARDQLGDLICIHPILGLRLLDQMRQRLHVSEMIIRELGFGTVEDRILGVFMRAGRRNGSLSKGRVSVPRKAYTHEGLSSMVGASREAVTRSLNRLQRRGIVERNRRDYIVNREGV